MENKVIDSFRGEYFFLSNFYPSLITTTFREFADKKFTFATGEHVFQAHKHEHSPWTPEQKLGWLQKLTDNPDPTTAKFYGRSIEIDSSAWNNASYSAMHATQVLKFGQHRDLMRLLLTTDGATLVEGNNWGDRLWGQVNGDGQNLLGKILMNLRDIVLQPTGAPVDTLNDA